MSVIDMKKADLYRVTFPVGLMVFGFGASTLYRRLSIDVQGTIVSSNTTCVQPRGNRCASTYLVREGNGKNIQYVSGPVDGSLPTGLAEGTSIIKKRWQSSYSLNGRLIDDFAVAFYVAITAFGLLIFGWVAVGLFRCGSKNK